MNVNVHKTRRDDAAGKVLYITTRISRGKALVAACGMHHLAARFIRADDQQAIFLKHGL